MRRVSAALPALVSALLALVLVAPSAAAQATPEVTDEGTGSAEVVLLRTTTAAMAPGEAGWIHLTWTTSVAEARQFAVTALRPDGTEVGYPENTVDHSSLYWDDVLSVSEIDYTAINVSMPEGLTVPLVLDVTVSYVSDDTEVTEHHTVIVPVEESGPSPEETEAGDGWEFDPYGTDTATSGFWEFTGSPDEIVWAGYTTQLGSTPSGSSGLFTAGARGADTGANDVDGGVTSVLSPSFALAEGESFLDVSWYFAFLRNAGTDDAFSISVVSDDGTTPLVQQYGRTVAWEGASWRSDRFDLAPWAGESIRLLVQVADNGEPSLIEAAVADLSIGSVTVPMSR